MNADDMKSLITASALRIYNFSRWPVYAMSAGTIARHVLDFLKNGASWDIGISTIEQGVLENIGLDTNIMFLAGRIPELCWCWVWLKTTSGFRAAMLDFTTGKYPTVFSIVPPYLPCTKTLTISTKMLLLAAIHAAILLFVFSGRHLGFLEKRCILGYRD